MSKINVLSKDISELIAAGEVIDRPASVIKELLENSIDSGATLITVEIKNGGRTFMRVTDNGCGIEYDDVPTAFLRHATSKVSSQADLDAISTLGFRGEALASVCAVARVDMLTKRCGEELGTHYRICGAVEEVHEQTGCPDGTTIIVKDIFYNVPARLKFLKKDVTEGNAVSAIVNKLALSHPEVSVKLIRDNKTELLTVGDGKPISSVYSVMGREFASSMIPVSYTYNGVEVSGFVCKPLLAKANHSFQNFFINHRYVKSMTCMHAVDEAYANLIMTGKVASCVLYIEVSPSVVDVNVHPTKTEVRFSNEKLIYDAVYFAVKSSLMVNGGDNSMSLEKAVSKNFSESQLHNAFTAETAQQISFDETPLQTANEVQTKPSVPLVEQVVVNKNDDGYKPDCQLNSRVVLQTPFEDTAESEQGEDSETTYKYLNSSAFVKAQPTNQPVVAPVQKEVQKAVPVVIGELFKTYIIVQQENDMFLIDKHAAHERFIFEKIKSDIKSLETQMLLEPVIVQLSFEEYDAVCLNIEKAAEIGFMIEPDVAPNVAVMGVPMIIEDMNPADVVAQIADNFISSKVDPQLDIFDELYHSLACKAAVKANDTSSACELEVIVKAVFNNENIRYCPHGRPVLIRLSKKDIEKQFRRIV